MDELDSGSGTPPTTQADLPPPTPQEVDVPQRQGVSETQGRTISQSDFARDMFQIALLIVFAFISVMPERTPWAVFPFFAVAWGLMFRFFRNIRWKASWARDNPIVYIGLWIVAGCILGKDAWEIIPAPAIHATVDATSIQELFGDNGKPASALIATNVLIKNGGPDAEYAVSIARVLAPLNDHYTNKLLPEMRQKNI
jgi:hypothetical protein